MLIDRAFLKKHSQAFFVLGVSLLIVLGLYAYKCITTEVCGNAFIERLVREDAVLTFPHGAITVEIANTKASREQGLSFRSGIRSNNGMLFVFDTPGNYAFWMKDMLFSIDMVWLSSEGRVVYVKEHATPESYPQTFVNVVPAQYVLEIGDGMAEKYGLYLGTKVDLARIAK
jgi:uncharacterized membrane protein (UPF0127 family)